jgi:uncharacterized membrane protein
LLLHGLQAFFYIPRLFIYYIEASEKSNPEKKNIDRSIYNNDESFVVYNNVAILNIGNFIWFLDGYFSAKLVV